jgi:hypothetical protein
VSSTTSPGNNAADTTPSGTRGALAYLAWDRWFQRLSLGVQGAADGLFLGIASECTLDRLDEQYYLQTPYYLTDAYNQRGLFDWERQAIERHFPSTGRIVVIGAGSGREMIALAGLGYEALGYESHEALTAYGQDLLLRTGTPGLILPMTRDQWPADPGPIDAVVIGWGVYHSIRTRPVRVAFLRTMRAALGDGTPVLLSFFTRQGAPLYQRTVARVGSNIRRLQRRPPIELGDVLAPFVAHQFSDGEIEAELKAAGFQLIEQGDNGYGWAVATSGPTRAMGIREVHS